MWNGSVFSVQGLIDRTGFTFPVLLNAGYLQTQSGFGTAYDNYILVDANGVVRYTSVNETFTGLGRFNDAAVRAAIQQNLPVPVAQTSWTTIKSLYQ